MKLLLPTYLLIHLLFFLNPLAYTQTKSYSGVLINSANNQPVEGATFFIGKNKTAIGTSKADGSYRFNMDHAANNIDPVAKLKIHHISYRDTVLVLKQGYQQIYLQPKANMLEEVVIQQKNINDIDIRNLVGSVYEVDIKKLSERSELDMGKLLEGQVPGLTVKFSGELGSKPEIRIRGNASFAYAQNANQPLFVMDGMIISAENFLTLNPQDFASIKVLKDAPATALYGIKAANGVIELTSKKGFHGSPDITLSLNQGITFRGERTVEMMGTTEKLAFEESIQAISTPGYRYSPSYIRRQYTNPEELERQLARGAYYLDSLQQYNTDWFRELVKPNTFQSYNLGIRGGTEKNSHFYSANYSKQGGRMPGNAINQFTARANLDYILTDRLSISLNNSFGLSTTRSQNGENNDPSTLVYALNPYETRESGKLTSYDGRSFSNLIDQFHKRSTSKRFSSSLIAHWDVLRGLNISGIIGIDYGLEEIYERIYADAFSQRNEPNNAKGFLKEGDRKNFGLTNNIRANYQRQFGDHDLYAGFNVDYYYNSWKSLEAEGKGISDDMESLSGVNASLLHGNQPKIAGNKVADKQLGFGAAMGYTFQNRYAFYASIKRDGSSMLPQEKRWNNAWSTGLGWTPSAYAFFKEQHIVTNLAFKHSIGYTASMAGINRRDIQTSFLQDNNFYGANRVLELIALPNKQLIPQQTYTANSSMDLGLFNRINLSVNRYTHITKQAIIQVPIASSNGFKSYAQNIGELQNSGIEIALSGDIMRKKSWRWNSSIAISHNKNRVNKLYGGDKLYLNARSVIPDYEVGQPLGIIYGLQSHGIHPLTGIPQYVDQQGATIDYNRPVEAHYFNNLGLSIAPYSGYFNHYIVYKNWSFTMNINFGFGGIAAYSKSYVRDAKSANYNALKGQLQQMWFEIGDENKIYPIKDLPTNINDLYQSYANNKTIYKTDFIKLNHLQLSYAINSFTGMLKYLKNPKIRLQADNLYTLRFEQDRGSLNDVLQPVLTFSLTTSF